MRKLIAALLGATFGAGAAIAAPGSLRLVDRIAGPDGGYDYLAVDSAAKRLFVGRSYGVMAVDLATKRVTERLVEADDVSAVMLIPGTDLMLSTVYGEDKAILFGRDRGDVRAAIPTGKSPDAAFYEPSSGLAFVMNAKSNDATLIDIKKAEPVTTIPMGGKPEAAVGDGRGRVYINIEDTAEVAVVDVARRKVVARYPLPGCEEPTGIAYDPVSRLLISACHNRTAKLIDARTGADRGSVSIGKDADGAIFDATRRMAYIPCKDGTLTVFGLDAKGKVSPVEVVRTEPGARTAVLDPVTGRVYLAASAFREEAGESVQVPGTFGVLVVAPQ